MKYWWHTSGEVIAFTETEIAIWLSDFREEILTTPITPEMPEWLFQADMSFTCDIPRKCVQDQSLDNVKWQNFKIMPFQDLSMEELHEELLKLFK